VDGQERVVHALRLAMLERPDNMLTTRQEQQAHGQYTVHLLCFLALGSQATTPGFCSSYRLCNYSCATPLENPVGAFTLNPQGPHGWRKMRNPFVRHDAHCPTIRVTAPSWSHMVVFSQTVATIL